MSEADPPGRPAPPPPPIAPADPLGDEFAWLLPALSSGAAPPGPLALRGRIFERVRRSAAASRLMHTQRHRDAPRHVPVPGVTLHTLYAATGPARRPGEPQHVCLVELDAGAVWPPQPGAAALQHEWLVLRGPARLGDLALAPQDFHLRPAGAPCPVLASRDGALLLLRQAALPARPGEPPSTDRAAAAAWAEVGPGIQRRVMWQRDGQAAMLYRAAPGAAVPGHAHVHDEECLMLQGDLFLDEVLLRALDYQLAPAGSHHDSVSTDTGVFLYAHGDVDLVALPP